MSTFSFPMMDSPTNRAVISSAKLWVLSEGCATTNLKGHPVQILDICHHISDLPIARGTSGPIEILPLDPEIIRQHLLRFGIFDVDWWHYSQSLVNKGLSLARDYLLDPLGLTVVFCGGAAALYLCLRGQGLHQILHPIDVGRHPNPIERQIPNQNPANQDSAGHGTAGPDPNQADANELAATNADVRPDHIQAAHVADRPDQDHTMADGSIQGEASKHNTTTPDNTKARNGAGRRKPNAQQPRSAGEKEKGKRGVRKPRAKKGDDQLHQMVTREMRKLRELQQ